MYLKQYDLTGRRAIVTGGARGIGYACADALAEAGADIVIVDIEGEAAEAAARKQAEKSGRRVDAGGCGAGLSMASPRSDGSCGKLG